MSNEVRDLVWPHKSFLNRLIVNHPSTCDTTGARGVCALVDYALSRFDEARFVQTEAQMQISPFLFNRPAILHDEFRH